MFKGLNPKKLPDMETEFEVDVEGNVTKTQYKGKFTFKIPSIKERAQADRKRAMLNGGLDQYLDASILTMNYMVAYLSTSLKEYPEWWKESDGGYDLHDANVIEEVYDRCTKFEKAWTEEVWGKKEDEPKP